MSSSNSGGHKKPVTWNSSLGAVLAVAGSAVGFGNFLRFPGLAAQYGGGAFMIAYFCAFLLLGIPLSWVEWTIGRRGGVLGGHSCASAFMVISRSGVWKYLGVLGVMTPLCISMYYLLLEGWTMGYAYHMAMGHLNLPDAEAYGSFFSDFVGLGGNGQVYDFGKSSLAVFFVLALLANFYVLYRGVTHGIEVFCKWSMPVLLLTALIVLVRVLTLSPDPAHPERNVSEGLGYMWNPSKIVLVEADGGKTVQMLPQSYTEEQKQELIERTQAEHPGKKIEVQQVSLLQGLMNPDLWITAAGQIFYSLSIGFGTILCYASYVGRRRDVALSSLTANAANEVVEVGIAGMMIVPATVSLLGVAAAAGASTFGLGFNVLPQVFAGMPGGRVFGALFFGLLSLAAITSSISIVQPAMSFMKEFWSLKRTQSVVIVGVITVVGSGMVSWYTDGLQALSTLDFWAGNLLLFIISGLYLVLFRFVWGTENGLRELGRGARIRLPRGLAFVINWVTPTILVAIFGSWVYKNAFVQICPEIQNLLDGRIGSVMPMLWLLFVLFFMFFVVHTSNRFRRHKQESVKKREMFS